MGSCVSAPDADDDAAPAELSSVTHEFTIRRYSRIKGMDPGTSIVSRYFTVDGRKWFARFYPGGYNPLAPSQHVALFVQTLYRPLVRGVRAHFTFALLRPDGSVAYARRSDRPSSFSRCCNSWGFREFVARDQLEGALLGVLNHDNDSFRVRCTVHVINNNTRRRNRLNAGAGGVTVPQSDFAANAIAFLNSGTAPFDIKFSVDGATFEAHRLVVAARSEWFAAAIYGHGETSWAEASSPCITVADTSPEAFQGVLHYIYHDALPADETMDAVMTRELFEAADMFLIDRLKKMCASRMCRFIEDDTVHSILELATAHSCEELERACRKHLRRRPGAVE